MNIKPFNQFFLESDESRLLKDLEDIGASERTWTIDEIQDALTDLDWAGNYEVVLVDPNNFEYSFNEISQEVQASFMGGISGEFDTSFLWDELTEALNKMSLNKDVDEDETLYKLDEIESAFDNVSWNKMSADFIENSDAFNSVEIEMTGRDEGEGSLSVEAEATFDSNNVEIDWKELVDAVLSNL
jgi:hypothetical protein